MSRIDELIQKLCPEGVKYQTLGDVAEYVRGVTYSKSDEVSDGGIGILRSNNINVKTSTIDLSNLKRIRSDAKVKEAQRLMSGDILMSAASGSKEHVGKVAFSFEDTDLFFGGFMAVIRSSPKIESRFLFHLLTSQNFSRHLDSVISSTTINNLSAAIINPFRIPVPPIEVQREIVSILDKFTALEAELETELETELEARKLARASLESLFHANKILSMKNAQQYFLHEIATFENGKPHEQLVDPDGECKLITSKFISSNGNLSRKIKFKDIKSPVSKNDITIVLSDLPNGRALAKCFLVDKNDMYAVNQRIAIIRPLDRSFIDPIYLYHYLNRNPQILRFDNGSTQTHLKKPDVMNTKISVPALDEQRRIADLLSKMQDFVLDLSLGLPAEIAARRKQYEHYRDKLLTFKELDVA